MREKIQYENKAERLKSRLDKQSLPSQTNFKPPHRGFVCLAPRFQHAGYTAVSSVMRYIYLSPNLSPLRREALTLAPFPRREPELIGGGWGLGLTVPHNSRNRCIAGFTLLELIIVVMIIGILSAIALPNWIAFVERQRLTTAQNQVYLALRSAQSEAKRTKVTWQASFREDNGVVQWAIHPTTANHMTANWNSLDPQIQIDQESTYKLLSTGIRRVEFGFMGEVKSVPLGRFTLSSKNSGQIKRCVFVSTLLGALRTAKENPTQKDGKYCY